MDRYPVTHGSNTIERKFFSSLGSIRSHKCFKLIVLERVIKAKLVYIEDISPKIVHWIIKGVVRLVQLMILKFREQHGPADIKAHRPY